MERAELWALMSTDLEIPTLLFSSCVTLNRNQRSNCQHLLDHWKSKRVPEKHLFLLYWLCPCFTGRRQWQPTPVLLPRKWMEEMKMLLLQWTEEPGRLQSMGLIRVRHDWATSLSLFTFMHWRRKWQLTPVFLPGESQGWRGLVGCCLWGRTELDTTEAT